MSFAPGDIVVVVARREGAHRIAQVGGKGVVVGRDGTRSSSGAWVLFDKRRQFGRIWMTDAEIHRLSALELLIEALPLADRAG